MRAGLVVITLKEHLVKIRMLETIKGLGRSTTDTLLIKYKSLNRMSSSFGYVIYAKRSMYCVYLSLIERFFFLKELCFYLFVMLIVSSRSVLILMRNKDQSLAGGLAWKASKSSFGFKIGELK